MKEDALNLLEILLGQIGDFEVVGRFVNPLRAIEASGNTPVDAVFLDNSYAGHGGGEETPSRRDACGYLAHH